MAAETDRFVIASFALWAGDVAYFERLILSYSDPSKIGTLKDEVETPEDFIKATGALRLRQLRHRRGEFNKQARKHSDQDNILSDEPYILETKHLRAALWRTDDRTFLMQCYLKDFTWEKQLFIRARELSQSRQSQASSRRSNEDDPVRSDGENIARRLGASWIIVGNPFIQVEVTDLGLIEATGIWTRQRLPRTSPQITTSFQRLLDSLDKPTSRRQS